MNPHGLRARILTAALAGVSCSLSQIAENNPITGGELSIEREEQLSAEIAGKIRAQAPFVTDPVLLAYLNEIGQRIVSVTEPQPFLYRFAIIDDETLNAFTIGGGRVYLNSGVIAQAGDVSELAGVIAHEIAHVRLRHVAQRTEGQGLATLATLATLAAVALSGADPALLLLPQGINVALQLRHTRQAEAEADRAGLDYLVRAGYDPDGMVRFFERIAVGIPHDGASVPEYLYTHPAVKERIAGSRSMIERASPPTDLERMDARLAEMQDRLAMLASPVAGGSGLEARARFDRDLADPLLEQAREEDEAGNSDRARELLLEARTTSPGDPRVPLRLAVLVEKQDQLAEAVRYLEEAFEIDSTAPLVQYRLGVTHARLGNRTRAVFYLEQAATRYRPGSAGRRRSEFEIAKLSLPVLASSGLRRRGDSDSDLESFTLGDTITWWGQVHRGFLPQNPAFDVSWHAPDGTIALHEKVRMSPLGGVSSTLATAALATGPWRVSISVDDSPVEEREFDLLQGR